MIVATAINHAFSKATFGLDSIRGLIIFIAFINIVIGMQYLSQYWLNKPDSMSTEVFIRSFIQPITLILFTLATIIGEYIRIGDPFNWSLPFDVMANVMFFIVLVKLRSSIGFTLKEILTVNAKNKQDTNQTKLELLKQITDDLLKDNKRTDSS